MNYPNIFPASCYPTTFFGTCFLPDGGKPIDTYIRQPIEWLVLEKDIKNGRALLLSKYVLDWEGFANCPILGSGYETSWKESYLRLWLNDEFFKENFSAEEQALILPINHAEDGSDDEEVIDRVFLLSLDEVKKYFPNQEDAVAFMHEVTSVGCSGTKDSPIELEYDTYFWWTRTSGATKDLVVCVHWDGELYVTDSNADELGVRPAVWVKF